MQLSMYYQSLYLQITKGYVCLKMECKDYILAQKTAIDALRFDPKDSELNMYAILAMGFQGNLSMAQTYYTAAKPYLALEHREDGAVMGNRKQPFGYKMSLGEIVIQESEAKLVQEIFHRYIAGESLNELTEALRQQDIPYDEGRLWNKNMIARILADTRYTGEKGYPKLIDEEQLIAANEKRSNKPQLPKKTEAQKVLRRLCGTPPSERVEQSVTDLLNGLANCPDCIRHQRSPAPALHSKTQEALDNALERQPIDEDSAKVLILQLAAEQYAALGNTAMADKNRLIRQITAAMETEIIPFPGGMMSLGDIERRLRELEQQFQTLLEKATDDPAAYGGQFKEILDEQTLLKERRSGILADNNEQAKDNQRILDAAQTLENASPHITEWDESAVRQLVETVKVLSKDEVAVTLKGGIEICQKIMY